MLEDLFYDLLVLYEGDDLHPALAFCTGKRVYFIDLLDQSGPILSVLFGGTLRFQDIGHPFILVLFFPFAPGDIAIVSIISNHLLTLVWDMRAHGRKPFYRIECWSNASKDPRFLTL